LVNAIYPMTLLFADQTWTKHNADGTITEVGHNKTKCKTVACVPSMKNLPDISEPQVLPNEKKD